MSRAESSFVQGWCAPLSLVSFHPWVARSSSATVPDCIPTLSAVSHAELGGGTSPEVVEGLRMTQGFQHEPVMAAEVVAMFEPVPTGVIVDATVGGGGHAALLLDAAPDRHLVALDRDEAAVAAASARLARFGGRVSVEKARFESVAALAIAGAHGRPIVGVLFDLGVSSPQLDEADRGFAYRFEGPLDMRMDRDEPRTAADIVNTIEQEDLVELLVASGEGRFARRLAEGIVAARPLETTTDLVAAIERSLPPVARKRAGHPAKRVFQALRIAVNEELDQLGPAVDDALELLVPGGRCVVISYHSGEDRLVKERFARAATGGCTCPPGLPCVCGAVATARVLTRGARLPSTEEVARNPRAASARLRAAERIATGAA